MIAEIIGSIPFERPFVIWGDHHQQPFGGVEGGFSRAAVALSERSISFNIFVSALFDIEGEAAALKSL